MYTPPMFKSDRAASLAFAEARGFGTACAWNGKRPVASSLPFYLSYAEDGTPLALFHVARHNPLVKLADGVTPWVLAVNGADAYVTPDWYVSVGSGADLALSGGASDRAGADAQRRRAGRADRYAERKIREPAGAEEAVDVGQDDGRAAGSAEERHRGFFHAGRGRRRQLQAEPAQVRGRLRCSRQRACGIAGCRLASHRAVDARDAAASLYRNN